MKDQLRNTNKIVDLIMIVIAILAIPEIAILLTESIYPLFKTMDPDETFLFITIHHLIQLVLTIITMLILSRKMDLRQWGFNLKNLNGSLKWIGIFLIVFFAIEYSRVSGEIPIQYNFPLTAKNKFGIQFFQYFWSGLGEEPLFRGFVMVFLATNWNKIYKVFKVEFPITIIIATALFMIAHMEIDFASLSVSGIDFDQQMKSLQLGILYGLAFHHTKSLLAPIVMHGLSNGIMFSIKFYLIN